MAASRPSSRSCRGLRAAIAGLRLAARSRSGRDRRLSRLGDSFRAEDLRPRHPGRGLPGRRPAQAGCERPAGAGGADDRSRAQSTGYPGSSAISRLVTPLHEKLVGKSRTRWACCSRGALRAVHHRCNVANLLMSRSGARQKEIALRMSVGGDPCGWSVNSWRKPGLRRARGVAGVFVASWLVNVVIG